MKADFHEWPNLSEANARRMAYGSKLKLFLDAICSYIFASASSGNGGNDVSGVFPEWRDIVDVANASNRSELGVSDGGLPFAK